MKAFSELFTALDETTRTSAKVAALVDYFRAAPAADAAWAVHFLSGNRPRRAVSTRRLREWASAEAEIPEWLFEECYEAVGDLAETLSLVVPAAAKADERPLRYWVEERLLPLRGLEEDEQRRRVREVWAELDRRQLLVWMKLLTGGFRVGVSRRLVVRALAEVTGVEAAAVAHRLMGDWRPTPEAFRALGEADTRDADVSRPYPFFLAHPLEAEPESLGAREEWQAEWKWDGIRTQIVRRGGQIFVWSRGEELVGERFPEIAEAAALLPEGTVVDGELLAWPEDDERPLPFAQLQRRIGRKRVGPKLLREVPAAVVAYDLLELGGEDARERPLARRRGELARLLAGLPAARARLRLSETVEAPTWEALAAAREEARDRGAEGLMLKRLDAPYGVGRRRGGWWKWKLDPYTLDAVLIYAQRGHGRRASLYTDYTFGLWHEGELVPFAKAYSGLTDAEIRRVDHFVRRHTRERFGPVRSVDPELVFEIAFEGIQPSSRHKSGLAVRFPRIHRWRTDKRPEDADTLETARALLG